MNQAQILKYLQREVLGNPADERYLTNMRSDLLRTVAGGQSVSLEILEALALFCSDCEYVLVESEEDRNNLAKLNPDKSDQERWMLACFHSFMREDLPVDEIASLNPLANHVSRAVAQQYEENPYPCWQFLPDDKVLTDSTEGFDDADILVAGCGTGLEALINARVSPRSRVIGIDLSRKSLAYALARARDFDINNVKFVQGDLQDVHLLKTQFDVIKCTGVLHHMAQPSDGLAALKSVLKPNGMIHVAVYSERARDGIRAAIELRKQKQIPATPDGIRAFRQEIIALPDNHPARQPVTFMDFYSMSGARDLLFHVQEINYTVRGFVELLDDAGFELVCFGLGEEPERRFRELGFTDLGDVDAWQSVEDQIPTLFSGMYRAAFKLKAPS